MKTWVIVLLVLVFVFVVVPLIYFAIIAKTVVKETEKITSHGSGCGDNVRLAKPPAGKIWSCNNGNWELV